MKPPSDHLLRTLAAVPVSSRVLDLGCGAGRHTEPLLRLGFPVHACDARTQAVEKTRVRIEEIVGAETAERCVQVVEKGGFDVISDDAFDWIVAFEPTAYLASKDDLPDVLATARRLLKPGGWVYLALAVQAHASANGAVSTVTPDYMTTCAEEAGLALSVAPERAEEHDTALVRGIFRRVEKDTPV